MGRTTNQPLDTTVIEWTVDVNDSSFTIEVTAGKIITKSLWSILPSGTSARIHMGQLEIVDSNANDVGSNYQWTTKSVGTNQIARYAMHTHHVIGPMSPQANSYQFTFVGNSVENLDSGAHDGFDFPKWGITIHGSHFGLIQDNVIYNLAGAAVVTEEGSETGNVFDHNMVVRAKSTQSEACPTASDS